MNTDNIINKPQTPQRFLAGLLIFAFVLTLGITELSSYLRLKEAGSDCTPWPDCYAHIPELLTQDALPDPAILTPHQSLKRVHRLMATLLVIVVIFILFNAHKIPAKSSFSNRIPLLMFFILLLLSLIGPFTPQKLYPVFALANIVLGAILLALISWLWWDLRNPPVLENSSIDKLQTLYRWGSRLLFVNILSGAWSSANFANTLTSKIPQTDFLLSDIMSAFNPFLKLGIDHNGNIIAHSSMAIISNTHYGLAIIAVAYYLAIAIISVQADKKTLRPISVVVLLLLSTAILGLLADSLPSPHFIILGHHLISVLLLLAAFKLNHLVTPRVWS